MSEELIKNGEQPNTAEVQTVATGIENGTEIVSLPFT